MVFVTNNSSAGYAHAVNVGALMEKGVRLIGNGQAPVHLYWKEILNDYILPGKFDPTLCVPFLFVTDKYILISIIKHDYA
jgi:hypothetical protein